VTDARVGSDDESLRLFRGLHAILLRLAGRMPDDWVTAMRGKVDSGEAFEVPQYVPGGVAELGVSLTAGDVALLREMTRLVYGTDPIRIDEVRIEPEVPATDHRFFPVPEGVLASDGGRIPARLDFTGRGEQNLWRLPPALSDLDDLALRLTDVEDQAVVVTLRRRGDVVSLARAWRFPAGDAPAGGVRVVLVEVRPDAPAWQIAGDLQRDLAERGVADPQVEVFWTGTDLPPYHRAALDGGALLWVADGGGV
jgi:hypothetical protein